VPVILGSANEVQACIEYHLTPFDE